MNNYLLKANKMDDSVLILNFNNNADICAGF
jgi:hypothetical protein